MITNADYMQIVSEAYDLSDPYIKKKVIFCNEAKRQENIENIVGRLYTHIKNDVTGIDFGTIPRSKGIITKIDNYNGLIDCINSRNAHLHTFYHYSTTIISHFYGCVMINFIIK